MSVSAFFAKGALQFLGWAMPFLLRKKYNKSALADLIEFDMLPRHEAARIDLGPTSSFILLIRQFKIKHSTVWLISNVLVNQQLTREFYTA
jgi:hypothetical protein